ncbi:Trans-1,2-dihydrobenzene-1,2-diol dehydrogenase [Heterocephalus glaber]|uniref:Trans-1,2-dihydrobenzene-1,2-diol dehydrogenase n=1 Tax=Heterocephalus glaber TaxID=10181 RepID=G5BAG7_HETGA|nr:Trans-1,2-dihydrobenzene-1,2-diol dehydrogenase [Heterocephalus glaber]
MALRWGIVSVGLISSDFTTVPGPLPRSDHQPRESDPGVLRVVAVAARELGRAQGFARKHGVPKAYGSPEELAKGPNVEVAYIGTQHPQHKASVLMSLAVGKAVLCEKPMGMNAPEVRKMVSEAQTQGLFLMEKVFFVPVAFHGAGFIVEDTVKGSCDMEPNSPSDLRQGTEWVAVDQKPGPKSRATSDTYALVLHVFNDRFLRRFVSLE